MKHRPRIFVLVMGTLLLLVAFAVFYGELHRAIAHRFDLSAQDNDIEEPGFAHDAAGQEVASDPDEFTPMAVGIDEKNTLYPVDAPLRGDLMARNRKTYDDVIDQFEVEENPRYGLREDDSYCNVFLWDVTRAMNAEIPAWIGKNGEPVAPFTDQDRNSWAHDEWHRMSANDINRWLIQRGPRFGWREVSAEQAQDFANRGHPTVASWYDPQGIGHTGVVRPGNMSTDGPAHAQAGIPNVNQAHVYDYFPREGTQFFTHY